MREARPRSEPVEKVKKSRLFWSDPKLHPRDFEPGELARHRENTVDENGNRNIRYTKTGDGLLDNSMAMLYEGKGYEVKETAREITFTISDAEYQEDLKRRQAIALERHKPANKPDNELNRNENRYERARLDDIRARALAGQSAIPGGDE